MSRDYAADSRAALLAIPRDDIDNLDVAHTVPARTAGSTP